MEKNHKKTNKTKNLSENHPNRGSQTTPIIYKQKTD